MNHCEQYKELLYKLHFLQMCGHGDDNVGDTVRDKMDVHWHNMTADEIKDCDGLSAQLYEDEKNRPFNKNDYERMIFLLDKFGKLVEDARKEYVAFSGERCHRFIDTIAEYGIDDLRFIGNYNGDEEEFYMPAAFVYDEGFRKKYRAEHMESMRRRLDAEAAEKAKKENDEKENRRKVFETLKKEFGK